MLFAMFTYLFPLICCSSCQHCTTSKRENIFLLNYQRNFNEYLSIFKVKISRKILEFKFVVQSDLNTWCSADDQLSIVLSQNKNRKPQIGQLDGRFAAFLNSIGTCTWDYRIRFSHCIKKNLYRQNYVLSQITTALENLRISRKLTDNWVRVLIFCFSKGM